MSKLIDLHIHSTSSDGIFKPAELLKIASEAGLSAIALADHDSVDGVDEAIAAAAEFNITVIPAVELSVEYGNYHDVHILGYFIDHKDPEFVSMLDRFCQSRESRGLRVIEKINLKLADQGREPVAVAEVMALAEGALGRPHIARILIEKGYCSDMQDAFNQYLLPCNVPKEYLPFDEAIREIVRIGGVPVLAHPQSITRSREELTKIICDMNRRGLGGIEAFNTMGIEGEDGFLRSLANTLGLAVTGGSDFHGTEEGQFMGKGRGNLYITDELIDPLDKKRPPKG
ncbi:MAG: PHP domain-containing protein [Geobacteraceae bacterium]|nr:PHP domain-containing protein [Geobacteraceae bacterium]